MTPNHDRYVKLNEGEFWRHAAAWVFGVMFVLGVLTWALTGCGGAQDDGGDSVDTVIDQVIETPTPTIKPTPMNETNV